MQKVNSRAALRRVARVADVDSGGDPFDPRSRTGRLMKALDWSSTALGPVHEWPDALKITLRSMLASRTPMLIWWGPDLVNLYNDACAEVFGRRRMETRAIGRPATEVRHEIWAALGRDVTEVLSDNRAVFQRQRLLIVKRNGRPEETYFSVSLTPLRDEWGRAAGVFGVLTDDTPAVLARRRLDTLHALSSSGPDGTVQGTARTAAATLADDAQDVPFAAVYLLDDDGRRAKLAATAGSLPQDGLADVELGSAEDPFRLADARHESGLLHVRNLPPAFDGCAGGTWPEAAAGAAVFALRHVGRQQPAGFLVLGISPRLPFDEEYRRFFELAAAGVAGLLARHETRPASASAKQKNEFLAMLAHELRNPLAPIRSAAELLRYVDRNPASLNNAREIIERQLGHLVRLMDDLLDVSRISRGKLELRREPVDVRVAAATAVESVTPAITEAGHELTVRVPAEPLTVSGDLARLSQVLGNLLANAAQYTEAGGHISLTVERAAGDVVLRVADDGIGIAEDLLPRVFEMFVQAEPRGDRPRRGLGIGLTISQRLVELHGGTLTAQSSGPERGSEFTVRLPLLDAAEDVRPAAVAAIATNGTARRRILVADDNTDAAAAIAEILGTIGHEVRTADDGLEAVAVAEAFRPDMILLDIGMPRLDGYEACRRIRRRPWGRDIAIYAVTGWGQASDRRRTREAGFNAHLVKPVSFAAIEKLIARTDH